MLCINNLTVKDAVFDNIIIDDLSFVVNDGDKIAIIGSEGTGKSTLLKLIAGRDLGYVDYHGEIIVNSSVYYLEQNIEYLWKDKTVEHYLYHDSLFLNEMIAEAKILFNHMSLDYFEFLDRRIGSLSGGEKVKIGLIKALLKDPDVLLLDEPSNDLDFETITFLEEFLIGFEKCVIFISHDRYFINKVATKIVKLDDKAHVFSGNYEEYLKNIQMNEIKVKTKKSNPAANNNDKEIKKLQKDIEELETEIREIQASLYDSDIYNNHIVYREKEMEINRKEKKLEKLYANLEELGSL